VDDLRESLIWPYPTVTVALAAAAFGESLGAVQLIGGALVIAAVLVMQWPSRPRVTFSAGAQRAPGHADCRLCGEGVTVGQLRARSIPWERCVANRGPQRVQCALRGARNRRLRTRHEPHSPSVTPAARAVLIASAPNTEANPTASWSLRTA